MINPKVKFNLGATPVITVVFCKQGSCLTFTVNTVGLVELFCVLLESPDVLESKLEFIFW